MFFKRKANLGNWLVAGLVICALTLPAQAVTFRTSGNPADTPAFSTCAANDSTAFLYYNDQDGQLKSYLNPPTVIFQVVSEEGFSQASPGNQNSYGATNPVFYTYSLTNEGNDNLTVYLTIESITYNGGGSGWSFLLVSAESGAPISSFLLNDNAARNVTLIATPAATAADGQNAVVRIKAYTNSTLTQESMNGYTGVNGLTYGGVGLSTHETTTTITGAPTLTLAWTSDEDAPTGYITMPNGGFAHDKVPGAIWTFQYTYSNTGSGTAENVALVTKVPGSMEACHVNATNEVVNATVTSFTKSAAAGWTVFTSEAGSPSRDYGVTANWTMIGTIDSNTDFATTEGYGGHFFRGISKTTTYIKFEKAKIVPTEDNRTLMWGVTIR